MILNDHTGIKMVKIWVPTEGGWGNRQVYKITRNGEVLGYVARALTHRSAYRAGWSWCVEDAPEYPHNWTRVGPSSTRPEAIDHLLSARSPSAPWLV
jgi:hypothetical protein